MSSFGFMFRVVGVALAIVVAAPGMGLASGDIQRADVPRDDAGLCNSLNTDHLNKYAYGSWRAYGRNFEKDKALADDRMRAAEADIRKEAPMTGVLDALTKRFAERPTPFPPLAVCFFTGPNAKLRNFGLVTPPWIATCEVDASTPDSDSLLAVLDTALPNIRGIETDPAIGKQGLGTIGFYNRFTQEDRKTALIRYAENLWEKYRSCDFQISSLVYNIRGKTDDVTTFAWKSGCNSWDAGNKGFFDDLVNDATEYPFLGDTAAAPSPQPNVAVSDGDAANALNPVPPPDKRPSHELSKLLAPPNGLPRTRSFFREYDFAYKSLSFCTSILNRTFPVNTKRFLCNNSNLLGGLMLGTVALLNGKTTSTTSTGLATIGGLLVTSNPITCASNVGGQNPSPVGGSGTGKPDAPKAPAKEPSSKPPR